MLPAVLVVFVDLFVAVFNILILIRVLMSWVYSVAQSSFGRVIYDLTEPVLGPIRKLLPHSEMIDFSPIAAFVLLQLLQRGVHFLLLGM